MWNYTISPNSDPKPLILQVEGPKLTQKGAKVTKSGVTDCCSGFSRKTTYVCGKSMILSLSPIRFVKCGLHSSRHDYSAIDLKATTFLSGVARPVAHCPPNVRENRETLRLGI